MSKPKTNENTIFPHCIQEGCGWPFDSSIKETRPLDTLKAFWFRYCPQHRLDPKGNTNVIYGVEHTPGPWQVNTGMVETVAEHTCKIEGCGVHIPICHMDRKPGNGTQPVERDANARLIALTPELLAACEAIESAYASNGNTKRQKEAHAKIRAVLAKYRGAK